MAGECPHISRLETTLIQYHDGSSPLMASTHETYLKIIDDLKNDLDQISCEVVMVQNDCSAETDEVGLENSLKELETQNDRLEQALKQQTQTKAAALTGLQAHNESLKCQIEQLRRTVFERDQHIVQLTSMLKNISQIQSTEPKQAALEYVISRSNFSAELEKKIETLSQKLDKSTRQEQFLHRETRKLTEELNESKLKNRDLVAQAHRLGELLKRQESHHMEFAAKYEDLEQNYEDQGKKLRTANNKLHILEERFQTMEKRQNEHNIENNLLREEVLSLKEKLACATGRQKSMQEHLLKTEKELYTAHDVMREQKAIMERNQSVYNEEQRRLQEANEQLKRKLAELARDYKKLQEEHESQKQINSQQLKIIENFRKWKDNQLRAEECTREGLDYYKNCINGLLQDKAKMLKDFHDLSKDYSLLQNELDRLKLCPLSLPNFNSFMNASERSIAERLEIVRRTTHRISQQGASFKDEEPSASGCDSSSTYRPSEEPL